MLSEYIFMLEKQLSCSLGFCSSPLSDPFDHFKIIFFHQISAGARLHISTSQTPGLDFIQDHRLSKSPNTSARKLICSAVAPSAFCFYLYSEYIFMLEKQLSRTKNNCPAPLNDPFDHFKINIFSTNIGQSPTPHLHISSPRLGFH